MIPVAIFEGNSRTRPVDFTLISDSSGTATKKDKKTLEEKRVDILAMIPQKRRARLTAEETAVLVPRAQAGEIEARNRLILGNVGLIMLVLREKCIGDELPREIFTDLIFTTINAIAGYRSDHGAMFSSYLGACLKFRTRTLKRRYMEGRELIPLDAPCSDSSYDNEAEHLIDLLPDRSAQREQELAFDRIDIGRALSGLDERDRCIVADYAHTIPLKETAKAFKVTPQHIEQKRKRIFLKLRSNAHHDNLLDAAASGDGNAVPDPDPDPEADEARKQRRMRKWERLQRLVADGVLPFSDAQEIMDIKN